MNGDVSLRGCYLASMDKGSFRVCSLLPGTESARKAHPVRPYVLVIPQAPYAASQCLSCLSHLLTLIPPENTLLLMHTMEMEKRTPSVSCSSHQEAKPNSLHLESGLTLVPCFDPQRVAEVMSGTLRLGHRKPCSFCRVSWNTATMFPEE